MRCFAAPESNFAKLMPMLTLLRSVASSQNLSDVNSLSVA